MLRTRLSATILTGALAGSAMAQAPNAGCALPSEPKGIPAAIDAAITGPADKDRACMKALLIPEARLMFVSVGADGDYLCRRAARRFAGIVLRLFVAGFLVLAGSNNCRMPCSNRPTAFSKAPSCPTRTIAMDGCSSNEGGRNTFTVSIE